MEVGRYSSVVPVSAMPTMFPEFQASAPTEKPGEVQRQ